MAETYTLIESHVPMFSVFISGKESQGIGPHFVRSFYTLILLLLTFLELLRRPTSSLRSALQLKKTSTQLPASSYFIDFIS